MQQAIICFDEQKLYDEQINALKTYRFNHPDKPRDQRHIYRYKCLQSIYELIAIQVKRIGIETVAEQAHLIYHSCKDINDKPQAEIRGTQFMPVETRLKAHIKFLRLMCKMPDREVQK